MGCVIWVNCITSVIVTAAEIIVLFKLCDTAVNFFSHGMAVAVASMPRYGQSLDSFTLSYSFWQQIDHDVMAKVDYQYNNQLSRVCLKAGETG